jgi:predicted nucleic acid-binding protein
MIAVDTNILVHSHRGESEWHRAALVGVSSLANGRSSWGIPWPCVAEFLAIVTHPRIFKTPTPLD